MRIPVSSIPVVKITLTLEIYKCSSKTNFTKSAKIYLHSPYNHYLSLYNTNNEGVDIDISRKDA